MASNALELDTILLSNGFLKCGFHPIFKQDENKLIIIGAILGLLVGIFQVTVIDNNHTINVSR